MHSTNLGIHASLSNECDPANNRACSYLSETVPKDVMALIVDHIWTVDPKPIDCITNLALVDKAMWQASATLGGRLPHFMAVRAIRAAVRSDCDTNKTLSALRAIENEPPISRPHLMRVFAENAPGLARIAFGHDLEEWDQMGARVVDWLHHEFGREWRGPQLRDLHIANLHAQFLPFLDEAKPQLEEALQLCLDTFPHSIGDLLETADALDITLPLPNWVRFLKSGTALSHPASDKFARTIGLKLLATREIADPIPCLALCGITKTQIKGIIIPACAISLSRNFAYRAKAAKAECKRWGKYAGNTPTQ